MFSFGIDSKSNIIIIGLCTCTYIHALLCVGQGASFITTLSFMQSLKAYVHPSGFVHLCFCFEMVHLLNVVF